jgi:hypothetical protein
MNALPFLAVLIVAGCATPTEELIREAKACVANHVNEKGVIGKPSDEERKLCWAEANRRSQAEYEREQEIKENEKMRRTYEAACGALTPVFERWGGGEPTFKGCLDPRSL